MANRSLYFSPVVLPDSLPNPLPAPKFQIGQQVRWAHVATKDFGTIVGLAYSSEASTQGLGYHYAIQLSSSSLSFGDGITSDWAFEDDIELYDSQRNQEDAIE